LRAYLLKSYACFGMEAEQAEVCAALAIFGEKLDALEAATRQVLSALDELRANGGEDDVPPLVRARVDATLAYALSALFCMYLRTQGQDPSQHPVREDIGRVRAAYVRIHEVASGDKGRTRKRAHAPLHSAELQLSKLLTDGERALHHAVNGATKESTGNGNVKKFDSSDDDGDCSDVKPAEQSKNSKTFKEDKEGREEKTAKKAKTQMLKKPSTKSSKKLNISVEDDSEGRSDIEPSPTASKKKSASESGSKTDSKKKRKRGVDATADEEIRSVRKRKSKSSKS
jgi:exosome complex protein LRP1